MRKTKAFILAAAILANCLLFALPIKAQVKFMPDYISVGSGSEPLKGYLNFLNVNGLNWKHLDHHFRIDLTGNAPAICGTNDRVDFADVAYGAPYYYIKFTCASVYSVWTNEFLPGIGQNALQRLSTMEAVKLNSERDNSTTYSLRESNADAVSKIAESTDEEQSMDYRKIVPVLFQSISELKSIVESQAAEINRLETMQKANKTANTSGL